MLFSTPWATWHPTTRQGIIASTETSSDNIFSPQIQSAHSVHLLTHTQDNILRKNLLTFLDLLGGAGEHLSAQFAICRIYDPSPVDSQQ